MADHQFWQLIGDHPPLGTEDGDDFADGVRERLAELSPDEVRAFDDVLNRKLGAACTWPLWAAGYLLNGGCSDDGFLYFRGWLVAQGRAVYEAALADPDSLADATRPDPAEDDCECEELLYVAMAVYEQQTGEELPRSEVLRRDVPPGESWDFEDDAEMAGRLPRLFATMGEG
jgi:hypothetical protein